MNWYKKSYEQLDLFKDNEQADKSNTSLEEGIKEPEGIEGIQGIEEVEETNEVTFLGVFNQYLAQFKIGNRYYGYWMKFSEWGDKVNYMARKFSSGKALNWAKEHSSESYEMEPAREYPHDLIIKRVIGE